MIWFVGRTSLLSGGLVLDTYTLGEVLNPDMETGNTSEKKTAPPHKAKTPQAVKIYPNLLRRVFLVEADVLLGLQISLFFWEIRYICDGRNGLSLIYMIWFDFNAHDRPMNTIRLVNKISWSISICKTQRSGLDIRFQRFSATTNFLPFWCNMSWWSRCGTWAFVIHTEARQLGS